MIISSFFKQKNWLICLSSHQITINFLLDSTIYCLSKLRFLYNYLSGMKLEFVVNVDGVDINVHASCSTAYYRGLSHMD